MEYQFHTSIGCICFHQLHTGSKHIHLIILFTYLGMLNYLENGSFRNRENLIYKKTAESVLLSLFMGTNGKCNNSYPLALA